jgi:putative hemolysin
VYQQDLLKNWRNVTETQIILQITFAILVFLDLLTAAARSSLVNASLSRLMGQADLKEGQLNRNQPFLSSIYSMRVGTRLAQSLLHFLLAGSAIGIVWPWLMDPSLSIWIVMGLLFVGLLVSWAEWLVEEWAANNADEWALKLNPFSKFITGILYPLLVVPLKMSSRVRQSESILASVTEDELKSLVDAGQQEGLLEKDERKMIYSIFRLGDTIAREIMIPRIDIMALDVETPLIEAVDTLLQSGYSRVPVYEETVDNVLGVLYTKDLLNVWREGNEVNSLRALLRPAYFVPEAKKVDELLAEMQSSRVHLAVVVDEYGGVAGVVSLEDIVEEIVGEIQDEYDQAEELPFQQLGKGEYIFQGRVDLDDFNEVMESYLPVDEADTIGGFIYNRIGRVPTTGESIHVDNLKLTVEQVTGRRIRKVRAHWLPIEVEEKKEESNVDK